MNICDKCHSKGACCREFHLNALTPGLYPDKIPDALLKATRELDRLGMSYFKPTGTTMKDLFTGSGKEIINWGCDKIGENGRCTDYDNRPDTCSCYEPMSDDLCAVKHLKGIPIFVEYI